jgi:hypothetical protein
MVKTMSENIDISLVHGIFVTPLSVCAALGQPLSPSDARRILKHWNEREAEELGNKPENIVGVERNGVSAAAIAWEVKAGPVTVNIPPLGPGQRVTVSDPASGGKVLVENMAQQNLMKYDPATGDLEPYPSHAKQYRKWHGDVAWLFNPWTGFARDPRDIGSDVRGAGIKEPTNDR